MALFMTIENSDANPPGSWQVHKAADRCWHLTTTDGELLDSFPTKRAANEAKCSGFLVNLYRDEARWMRGEPVRGWKPYNAERLAV